MAYDAAQHLLVLFGGTLSTTPAQMTNETWGWNGRGWQQFHPATSPPALEGIMAYDAASQHILLFLYDILGGGRIENQMWAWDGATWQPLHPSTMPEVVDASMVYDAARRQVVFFGGRVPAGRSATYTNSTWTWNGTTWSQRAPATAPTPRADAASTYDSTRQQVALYGGFGASGEQEVVFNDLWTWDGATWQQQHPAQVPSARQPPHLVYDDAMRQAILFWEYGPPDAQSVAWAWNGMEWTQIAAQWAPANFSESAAYDPDQRAIVVYAAKGNPKATPPESPISQTWIWKGSSWNLLG